MKNRTEVWMLTARHDVEASRYNFRGNLYDVAAFYAQQAAEKALKALSIELKGRFKKTHDLVELAAEVKAPVRIEELCATVSPAYTATRYPDMPLMKAKEDAEAIMEASREVMKWVESRLE